MQSSASKQAKRTNEVRHKIHSVHLRRLFFIYGICILASALAAGTLAHTRDRQPLPDPYSAVQRTTVPFVLYYPKSLPTPYYTDMASLGRLEESVVAMRITNGKGQEFTISQQALPPTIDLEALYQSFSERMNFKTKLGRATTGTIDNGNTRMVSLVADNKTWVLVQAPTSVRLADIQSTLKDLTPSH